MPGTPNRQLLGKTGLGTSVLNTPIASSLGLVIKLKENCMGSTVPVIRPPTVGSPCRTWFDLKGCRHDVKGRALCRQYCGYHHSWIQYELSRKILNTLVRYGIVGPQKPLGDTNSVEFLEGPVG